jgi:hypothetical protein
VKLDRTLTVGGTAYPVIEERVLLDLAAPGRAQFLINGQDAAENQPVTFDIGWGMNRAASRLFDGYVEQVVKVDGKRMRLFCREYAALLANTLPLNLRHVTMTDVLGEITRITGLRFSPGAGGYATTKAANFYNLGSGYQAMAALSRVYRIQDYIWQQQGDRIIYAGRWSDSRWNGRDIEIPEDAFDAHLSNRSASIVAIPQLRPGVKLNGNVITRLEFSGHFMEIQWKSRLNASS